MTEHRDCKCSRCEKPGSDGGILFALLAMGFFVVGSLEWLRATFAPVLAWLGSTDSERC